MRPRLIALLGAAVVVAVAACVAIFGWPFGRAIVQPITLPQTRQAPAAAISSAAKRTPPASCLKPGPAPVPPNGAVAHAEDMRLAREVIQHFVEQLEGFQACKDAQADLSGPGVPQAQKDAWIREGDDAVDEAHALADLFSIQLEAFNARKGAR